jgi:hypothetical protein
MPHVLGRSACSSLSRRGGIGSPFSSNASGWKPETIVSSTENGESGRLTLVPHGSTTSGASWMTSFDDAGLR